MNHLKPKNRTQSGCFKFGNLGNSRIVTNYIFNWNDIMRNILNIFKLDMKNITTNWVVAVLIGGLIILPSLYAWLNIKASWDPYGQTDQIPIGIVNEDTGTELRDEQINVGNELVETLKVNDDFNWKFVDREKAMEEVEYGNYFAVIVIPENFSTTLGSVVSEKPTKANIEYYVNEKINAIAPKITDKGASVIVEQMSSEFVSTVNGVIFDMFNQIGLKLEEDLPDIKQFESYLFTLEENLPEIHETLVSTNKDAENADEMIAKAKKMIPQSKAMTDEGLETINNALELLSKAEKRMNELAPKIDEDVQKAQDTFEKATALIADLKNVDVNKEDVEATAEKVNQQINGSLESLEEISAALSDIQNNSEEENETITNAQNKITELQTSLTTLQSAMTDMHQFAKENGQQIEKIAGKIAEIEQVSDENFQEFITTYKNEIKDTVSKEISNVTKKMNEAKGMLTDIQSTIPKVDKLLTNTSNHLNEGEKILASVLNEFPYVKDKVTELANRIRKLQSEADVNEIIELLKNDPESEKGFFAEPVVLNKNELFPIPNYGTGMTPFYTVLSLWVGALLLISLLSTELPAEGELRAREIYIGRLLTFLSIGIMQTFIVTVGDIYLIGVQVSSPLWFILFGILISIIFMTIVYTVVSIFGDVGKAIAIVLLVLQIAGSGGTYPVVLLPEFFQAINPFLPFTYAVDLMREAVGGIIWKRAWRDIGFLIMFGSLFLTMGLLLKGPVNRHLHKLLQSKGSRLFH